MNSIYMQRGAWCVQKTLLAIVAMAMLVTTNANGQSVQAQSQQSGEWQFEASVYLFLPTVSGQTNFPSTGTGSEATATFDILGSLQFTFMGSFELRRNHWGLFTDFIYLDLGNSESQSRDLSLGGVELPANVVADLEMNLTGLAWTLASTYRAVEKPAVTLDFIFGARLLDIEPELTWQLAGNIASVPIQDRAGQRRTELKSWDAILGVKGRAAFGPNKQWVVPYELDIGTGDSEFTWQALAGFGYAFSWGEITAAWRYLDYQLDGGFIEDLDFSGPTVAVNLRW